MMRKVLIGILVLLLGALLLIPSFFNLDGYKQAAAQKIEEATGKRAEILGNIDLSLLPVPTVSVADVHIANAKGGSAQYLANIGSVEARLALLPLFSGKIVLSGITLVNADISLETFLNGSHNWDLPKAAKTGAEGASGAISGGGMIPVQHIAIRNGSITLFDHATRKANTVKPVNISTEIESTSGPFSVEGDVTWEHLPLHIEARSGQFAGSNPVQLNAVLSSDGLSFVYEGQVTPGDMITARGKTQLHATNIGALIRAANPASTIDLAVPLESAADVDFDGKKISFGNFKLLSGEQEAKGSLAIQVVPSLHFDIALDMPELYLDKLSFGTPAAETAPIEELPDDIPVVAPSPTEDTILPKSLSVKADVDIGAIHYHQEKIEKVAIHAEAADGALVVHEAGALLPGSGKVSAFGLTTRRNNISRFEGTLELAGKDLRALLNWLGIDTAVVPQESLKAYALKGGIMISPTEMRLSETNITFDNTALSGAVIFTRPNNGKKLPTADVTLRVNNINLDNYIEHKTRAEKEKQLTKEAEEQVYPVLNVDWLRNAPMDIKLTASIDTLIHNEEPFSNNFLRMELKPEKLIVDRLHTVFRGVNMDGKGELSAKNERPYMKVIFNAGNFDTALFFGKEDATTTAGRPGGSERWDRTPVDFRSLRLLDGDFELGFTRFQHRKYTLDNTLVSASLKDGTLAINKLQGNSFGGAFNITGSITSGALPALAFTYALDSVDLHDFLEVTADIKGIGGYASLRGQARTSGVSEYDFISNLLSNNNVVIREAVAQGFDINTMAAAVSNINSIEDVINIGRLASSGGQTAFNSVNGSIAVKSGVLTVPKALFDTERATGELTGSVDLPKWVMNLLFNFSIKKADASSTFPPVGLSLKGDADNPTKSLDTKALEEYIAKRAAEQLLRKTF